MCQAETPSYAPLSAPATQDDQQQMTLHEQQRHYRRPCRRRGLELQTEGDTYGHHHAERQPCSLAREHEPGTGTTHPATIHHRQQHPQRHHQDVERETEDAYRKTLSEVTNVVLKGRKGKRVESKVNQAFNTLADLHSHLSEAERTGP